MMDPQTMSPGSIMPTYPWLLSEKYNKNQLPNKVKLMRKLGVPYPEGFEDEAIANAETQADGIVKSLADAKITTKGDREIIALIAYLQRMGTDIKKEQTAVK
jgi:cytochrome c oxidase cbb3-type subunit I/II